MNRLLYALALAMPLASCATIPAPGQVADQTTLDERAALGVELTYRGARMLAEAGVDAGLIRGERATQIAALDQRAYAAVSAVRSAYEAGNAVSYASAAIAAEEAVAAFLAAIRG